MSQTDILFAMPGFFGGMASVLDVGATLVQYNESSSPELADLRAMKNDWTMVGQDIRSAMTQFEESSHAQK